MSKWTLVLAAMLLAGCASWRDLSIDSSNEAAFDESLTQMYEELPRFRGQLLALALDDIVLTGLQTAGQAEDGSYAYSDDDFRAELDGLTYDGVIALADETGTPIRRQYYLSGPPARPRQVGASSPWPAPHVPADSPHWPVSNSGLILSDSWKEIGVGR